MKNKSSFVSRQLSSVVPLLLLSFTLGSVLLLASTLIWHSSLVIKMAVTMHSKICECALIRLVYALTSRRRTRRRGASLDVALEGTSKDHFMFRHQFILCMINVFYLK